MGTYTKKTEEGAVILVSNVMYKKGSIVTDEPLTHNYTNGDEYTGIMNNGVKTGAGKLVTSEGTFVGTYKSDVLEGMATFIPTEGEPKIAFYTGGQPSDGNGTGEPMAKVARRE